VQRFLPCADAKFLATSRDAAGAARTQIFWASRQTDALRHIIFPYPSQRVTANKGNLQALRFQHYHARFRCQVCAFLPGVDNIPTTQLAPEDIEIQHLHVVLRKGNDILTEASETKS